MLSVVRASVADGQGSAGPSEFGNHRSPDGCDGFGLAEMESSFDRDREPGQIGVADHLAELLLGFRHPGCGPPQAHLPQRTSA